MKLFILTALLTALTATASAAVVCEKIGCTRDLIADSPYNYCEDVASFQFEIRKKSGFLITLTNKWSGVNQYFGEFTSSSSQQVSGKSEDLVAEFNIDAKEEKGQVIMYRRGTGLIHADFQLRCVGTLY